MNHRAHLWKQSEPAKWDGYLPAWCGRQVRHSAARKEISVVSCDQCKAAFAKHLRSLPDVFKEKEP